MSDECISNFVINEFINSTNLTLLSFIDVEPSNDVNEFVTITFCCWVHDADDSLGLFTIADFRESHLDCFSLLTVILHFGHRKITPYSTIDNDLIVVALML